MRRSAGCAACSSAGSKQSTGFSRAAARSARRRRLSAGLLSFFFLLLFVERELFGRVFLAILEVGHEPLVREVHRMGVLPVAPGDLVQPVDDLAVAHLDGELAPAV